MKKFLKIILVFFAVVIIATASLAVWQWENIKSIKLGASTTTEEIAKMRTENQQQLVESLQTFLDVPIRDMTEEEKRQVDTGEVTATEVYQKIFEERNEELKKEQSSENNADDKKDSADVNKEAADGKDNSSVSKPEKEKTAEKRSKDEIISSAMSKLYGLQNKYTAIAESTIAQGAQYYESIKKHDSDPAAKAATISRYTSVVRGVEGQCDGEVEAVLSTLKAELEAIGADTSVINSIRQTYAGEKQLKLSYYSSRYLN